MHHLGFVRHPFKNREGFCRTGNEYVWLYT